jgi:OOP family OmpA-OmpF porin
MKKKFLNVWSIVTMSLLVFGFGAASTFAGGADDPVIIGGKKVILERTADNFIVMYDSSSSMGAPYRDTILTEVEAAREILMQKNQDLPDLNWQAGIFSHTPGLVPLTHFKTYLPMQVYNNAKFANCIETLPTTSSGPTLLQGGLDAIDGVLAGLSGRTVVFLFTDGQYTDQDRFADPVTIAMELDAKHDVCFAVISSATTANGKSLVDDLAGINECSVVIPFSALLNKPEKMNDDLLYRIREVRVEEPKEAVTAIAVNNVLFDFDKAEIKTDFIVELNKLTIFMQENPYVRVILAGHTDSIGSDIYNQELSHRRAGAVCDYLVSGGIDTNRIALNWFGESNPAASNDDEEGRSQNRRVTAVITGME